MSLSCDAIGSSIITYNQQKSKHSLSIYLWSRIIYSPPLINFPNPRNIRGECFSRQSTDEDTYLRLAQVRNNATQVALFRLVRRVGFEPTKPEGRQIYSLL